MSQESFSPRWSLAAALMLTCLVVPPALAEDGQAERISEGQEAPAFSLQGSDGETYTLTDLRGENDVALVFFRGNW